MIIMECKIIDTFEQSILNMLNKYFKTMNYNTLLKYSNKILKDYKFPVIYL